MSIASSIVFPIVFSSSWNRIWSHGRISSDIKLSSSNYPINLSSWYRSPSNGIALSENRLEPAGKGCSRTLVASVADKRDVPVRVLVALYHRRIPLSCSSSVFLRRIDLPLSLTRWPHLRFSSFSRAFGSFLSFAKPRRTVLTRRLLLSLLGSLASYGPLVDPMADGQWRCAARRGDEGERQAEA